MNTLQFTPSNEIKSSPTDILEDDDNPHLEHLYARIPGELMAKIDKDSSSAGIDFDKGELEERLQGRDWSSLHTHPIYHFSSISGFADYLSPNVNSGPTLPSDQDLRTFMTDKKQKTMIIAQQSQYGRVHGYFFIRKNDFSSRKDKSLDQEELSRLNSSLREYRNVRINLTLYGKKGEGLGLQHSLDKFLDKYNLQARYVPRPGFKYEKGIGFIVDKKG